MDQREERKMDCISCNKEARLSRRHLCPACEMRDQRGWIWPQKSVQWDTDMDEMLLRLDAGSRMGYAAIAHALTTFYDVSIGENAVIHRLRALGRPPRRPRGVPFGSQARELICR